MNDQSNMRFYQLPKQLFENPYYKEMNIGSKTMYAILRDRQDLSIANKWVDDKGFIFFYYDVNNLSEYMNISTSTINRYKKELHKYQLLVEVRQGLNKPNRLYILKPESVENALISQNDYSRTVIMISQDMSKSLSNDTELKETEIKDTNLLRRSHFDVRVLNLLNSFSINKFGKGIRKHKGNYDLEVLEDMVDEELLEVFEEHLIKYEYCNMDYLQTIQYREL
jgi:hypothetical protein